MIQLNLTPEEASTLKAALENYISDLRMEIADTEQMEFREQLKEREMVLKKIATMLSP